MGGAQELEGRWRRWLYHTLEDTWNIFCIDLEVAVVGSFKVSYAGSLHYQRVGVDTLPPHCFCVGWNSPFNITMVFLLGQASFHQPVATIHLLLHRSPLSFYSSPQFRSLAKLVAPENQLRLFNAIFVRNSMFV